MSNVELLELVDDNDEIVMIARRDEVYAQRLYEQYLVRVVDGFVRRPDGRLWIPIRTLDKTIAPGGFDVGPAGHVTHGETYDQAFRKELFEELGWNLDDFSWRAVGKFGRQQGLATMSMVYEVTTDQEPALNEADFVSAEWLHPQEVADRILAGHPAKSNLLPLLKTIYDVSMPEQKA